MSTIRILQGTGVATNLVETTHRLPATRLNVMVPKEVPDERGIVVVVVIVVVIVIIALEYRPFLMHAAFTSMLSILKFMHRFCFLTPLGSLRPLTPSPDDGRRRAHSVAMSLLGHFVTRWRRFLPSR